MPLPPPYGQQQAVGNGLSTAGIVLGIIGFFFLPIIVGVIGIVLSVMAKNKGESRATVALGVSITGTVLGMIVGALFFLSL
jgi:putative effector of murein hydrolase LrgA (UPF0299 family)